MLSYALILFLLGLASGLWASGSNYRYADLLVVYLSSFFGVSIVFAIFHETVNIYSFLVPLAYTIGYGFVLQLKNKLS